MPDAQNLVMILPGSKCGGQKNRVSWGNRTIFLVKRNRTIFLVKIHTLPVVLGDKVLR
jgi:hypothetical protein